MTPLWTTLTEPLLGALGGPIGAAFLVVLLYAGVRWSRPYLIVAARFDSDQSTHRIWIQNQDPVDYSGLAAEIHGVTPLTQTYVFGGVGKWKPRRRYKDGSATTVVVGADGGLRSYGTWLIEIVGDPSKRPNGAEVQLDLHLGTEVIPIGTEDVNAHIGVPMKPAELVVVAAIMTAAAAAWAGQGIARTPEVAGGALLAFVTFIGWAAVVLYICRPARPTLTQGYHGWDVSSRNQAGD